MRSVKDGKCMICGAVIPEGRHICLTCEGTDDLQIFRNRPKTNGDYIRAMSNAELAEFLASIDLRRRNKGIIRDWLERPYKEK